MSADYHITLVRHGESAGNADNIYQGQQDYPLTDTGRLQARLLGERWQAEGRAFSGIVSSPLLRALETAEIIAHYVPASIELDPNWMERHFGKLSGLTAAQADEQHPRPAYIGLANTLVAPATILSPFLGGWLADQSGYTSTFLFSAIGGVATLIVLHLLVKDPKHLRQTP